MSENEIQIKVSLTDVEDRIARAFGPPHGKLVAHVIMGNLRETDKGLEQLVLSMQGIFQKHRYKPTDEVMIPYKNLETWAMSQEKMNEAGYIFQGFVEANVIQVNQFRGDGIEIEYTAIDSSGKPKKRKIWVNESVLQPAEEFPFENFEREHSTDGPKDDDGLPF